MRNCDAIPYQLNEASVISHKTEVRSSPKETQVYMIVAFLLEKLYATGPGIIYHLKNSSRIYVRAIDPGPGAPGKMDRLNLRFFWRRVYSLFGLQTIDYECRHSSPQY